MQAQIGDWIIVESVQLNATRQEGQVVELRHPDGSPPYLVHWLDTGQTTLVFPGPDARVLSHSAFEARAAQRSAIGRSSTATG